MEEMLLNAIEAINQSRFWLGPLLLFCVFGVLAMTIVRDVQKDIEQCRKHALK